MQASNVVGLGRYPRAGSHEQTVRTIKRRASLDRWCFFVVKSNGLHRIIIDGRQSNTFFDPAEGKFSLFTVETVRQVLDNLSVDANGNQQEWYALNFDRRVIGSQIQMTDRNNSRNAETGCQRVLPRLPSSLSVAPGLCF